MKKSIKYFGVTAAALLAVAPSVAPVVGHVAPTTVSAAGSDDGSSQANALEKSINETNTSEKYASALSGENSTKLGNAFTDFAGELAGRASLESGKTYKLSASVDNTNKNQAELKSKLDTASDSTAVSVKFTFTDQNPAEGSDPAKKDVYVNFKKAVTPAPAPTAPTTDKTASQIAQTVLDHFKSADVSVIDKNQTDLENLFETAYQSQVSYSNFSNSAKTGEIVAKTLDPYFSITNIAEQDRDNQNTYSFKHAGDNWSAKDTARTIYDNTREAGSSYSVDFVVEAKTQNVDTAKTKTVTLKFTNSQQSTGTAHVDFASGIAKKGSSISNFKLGYEAVKSLKMTDEKGSTMTPDINSLTASIANGDAGDNAVIGTENGVDKFVKFGTAVQTLNFTVPVALNGNGGAIIPSKVNDVPKNGAKFDLGNGVVLTQNTPDSSVPKTQDGKSGLVSYSITRNVQVYADDNNAQPFFAIKNTSLPNNTLATLPTLEANKNSKNNYEVKDGAIQASDKDSNVNSITSSLQQSVQAFAGDQNNVVVNITKDQVISALTSAGATYNKEKDTVNGLTGRNVFTLTVSSPINQKQATLRFVVNFQTAEQKAKEDNQPRIAFSTNAYKDGETVKADSSDAVTLFQGQQFKPLADVTVFENNGGLLSTDADKKANYYADAQKVSKNVPQIDNSQVSINMQQFNNNVPGEYDVVYSVTNAQGLTTNVTRKVRVLALNNVGIDKVVNYKANASVLVWGIAGDAVNPSTDFIANGTTVKTFDTKTVDGISYTRVKSAQGNQWVQSKYFDANSNNDDTPAQNNTNTSSNQETPMQGELTINYVPGFRVFLRDGQANMQQQSVGHGEAYKVWAVKTVGEHKYYRIGTDAQWIEDTYAQF
ncbi:hypothetical protein [Holzapfeliella sp. JNUCC 72]